VSSLKCEIYRAKPLLLFVPSPVSTVSFYSLLIVNLLVRTADISLPATSSSKKSRPRTSSKYFTSSKAPRRPNHGNTYAIHLAPLDLALRFPFGSSVGDTCSTVRRGWDAKGRKPGQQLHAWSDDRVVVDAKRNGDLQPNKTCLPRATSGSSPCRRRRLLPSRRDTRLLTRASVVVSRTHPRPSSCGRTRPPRSS
jgi:hypothetical protein